MLKIFLFTWKCVRTLSDITSGIIIWLNLHVCCVCPRCPIVGHNKGLEIQAPGSYLDVEAPHIFIKNHNPAAEAPLHHNVTEPHKGKHMRPGLNLQIWPSRWIFCASLFYKFKCKWIHAASNTRLALPVALLLFFRFILV